MFRRVEGRRSSVAHGVSELTLYETIYNSDETYRLEIDFRVASPFHREGIIPAPAPDPDFLFLNLKGWCVNELYQVRRT